MLLKDKNSHYRRRSDRTNLRKIITTKGADVNVYERDKDPKQGFGEELSIFIKIQVKTLKEAGLLDKYLALATPMGATITDEKGNVLSVKHVTLDNQHDNPEINRNTLRTMLLDNLTENTVIWDQNVLILK